MALDPTPRAVARKGGKPKDARRSGRGAEACLCVAQNAPPEHDVGLGLHEAQCDGGVVQDDGERAAGGGAQELGAAHVRVVQAEDLLHGRAR